MEMSRHVHDVQLSQEKQIQCMLLYSFAQVGKVKTPDHILSLDFVQFLVKHLESLGYKCYYQDRDAVPGATIFDNFFAKLDTTKWVLVVITEEFTTCSWNRFYEQSAFRAELDLNIPHFIPILIGQAKLPKELRLCIPCIFDGAREEWDKSTELEKIKKVLNTVLTDSSGEAEHVKHSSTDIHEQVSEADSALECTTQIWSPPTEKQKVAHVKCQTNIQMALKCRDRCEQARPDVKSKGTQDVTRVSDVESQCSLVKLPSLHTILKKNETEVEYPESCSDSDGPANTDQDPDYVPESEVCDVEDTESDHDCVELLQPLGNIRPVDERYFLVSECQLLELLKVYRYCKGECIVEVKNVFGTMITVDSVCCHGHTSTWHSQNMCQKMPLGNLLLSNAILVSGNSPSRIISLFHALNCPIFCNRTYDNLQTNYLIPSVYRLWDLHQADNITAAQGSLLILGGDRRCDSPGHSAKYCSYTVIDLETNIILDLQLVQALNEERPELPHHEGDFLPSTNPPNSTHPPTLYQNSSVMTAEGHVATQSQPSIAESLSKLNHYALTAEEQHCATSFEEEEEASSSSGEKICPVGIIKPILASPSPAPPDSDDEYDDLT